MLQARQLQLLIQVVKTRCPQLLSRVELSGISALSHEERGLIIKALSDEFVTVGIGEDAEPNQQGLQLEELLDIVNRPEVRSYK